MFRAPPQILILAKLPCPYLFDPIDVLVSGTQCESDTTTVRVRLVVVTAPFLGEPMIITF